MIAFEVEMVGENAGRYCPIVVCDHCHAKIKGSGSALWARSDGHCGLSIGDRFQFEPQIFHVHKHCASAFEAAYQERYGQTRLMWADLWKHLAQTLSNMVASDNKPPRRILDAVERVVTSGRKS